MENCFKTQLKSVVNNDNLDFLNLCKIYYPVTTSSESIYRKIILSPTKQVELKIKGGKFMQSDMVTEIGDTVTLSEGRDKYAYISNNVESIVYVPMYDIQGIGSGGNEYSQTGRIKDTRLFQCNEIMKFNISLAIDTIVDLNLLGKYTELWHLYLRGINTGKITGNLSSLRTCVSLENLVLNGNSDVAGDIASLGNSKNLERIRVDSSLNVYGSIDDLAAAIASSRNNGSTLKITGNGVMTFKSNGDGTGEDVIIPDGTAKTITFNGAGGYIIA